MTDQPDAATSLDAFRRRLAAFANPAGHTLPVSAPALPSALPVGGALAGVDPLEVEGGLALSAWFFRRRLRALGGGDEAARYRSPFDPI